MWNQGQAEDSGSYGHPGPFQPQSAEPEPQGRARALVTPASQAPWSPHQAVPAQQGTSIPSVQSYPLQNPGLSWPPSTDAQHHGPPLQSHPSPPGTANYFPPAGGIASQHPFQGPYSPSQQVSGRVGTQHHEQQYQLQPRPRPQDGQHQLPLQPPIQSPPQNLPYQQPLQPYGQFPNPPQQFQQWPPQQQPSQQPSQQPPYSYGAQQVPYQSQPATYQAIPSYGVPPPLPPRPTAPFSQSEQNYQTGYQQALPVSTQPLPPPNTFGYQPAPTRSEFAPPPLKPVKPGFPRIGASVSNLVQSKLQGYMAKAQAQILATQTQDVPPGGASTAAPTTQQQYGWGETAGQRPQPGWYAQPMQQQQQQQPSSQQPQQMQPHTEWSLLPSTSGAVSPAVEPTPAPLAFPPTPAVQLPPAIDGQSTQKPPEAGQTAQPQPGHSVPYKLEPTPTSNPSQPPAQTEPYPQHGAHQQPEPQPPPGYAQAQTQPPGATAFGVAAPQSSLPAGPKPGSLTALTSKMQQLLVSKAPLASAAISNVLSAATTATTLHPGGHGSSPSPQAAPAPNSPAGSAAATTTTTSRILAATTAALGNMTASSSMPPGVEYTDEDDYTKIPMALGSVDPSSGAGNASLGAPRLCFEHTEVPHGREWYVHPEAPTFLICGWCYARNIAPTALAAAFTKKPEKQKGVCGFHFPRVQRCLWPAAVSSGNLGDLVEYAKKWAEIARCKRENGAVYADGMRWYVLADDEIPGFLACEGCYEGVIRATRFAAKFAPHGRGQSANEKWTCDASLQYVLRALLHRSRLDDWAGFVRGVGKRVRMERTCTGKPLTASKETWYRPRGAPAEFRVCETCYTDAYAESRFEAAFERVEETPISKWTVVRCDAKGNIPVQQLAWIAHVTKKPVEYLRAGLVEVACKPKCCTEEGITGGRYYNFHKEVGNFGVCEACFIGCVRPVGMDAWFAERPRTIPGAALCAFNPYQPRFGQFIDLYNEALETGIFDGYERAVRKWSPIPHCAKRQAVKGRAWYGWEDCGICPECYETFAAGTSLVSEMPLQNTYQEGSYVCCMYSPRQRERYTLACKNGNANELLAASRIRQAVYLETVMLIDEMRQRQQAEMNAADTQMFISTTHMCSDITGTVFGTNTYSYTSGGYGYKSDEGVMAEKAWNSGLAMRQRALDPNRMMEIQRLEARWAEFE